MSNTVIFGATQCGKSTLAGYLVSATLGDHEFNEALRENQKRIKALGGAPLSDETAYISFVSMDRDELSRPKDGGIGSTKRAHRKTLLFPNYADAPFQELLLIDSPGSRSEERERYYSIFEGDTGICILSARDILNYEELQAIPNSQVDHSVNVKMQGVLRRLFDPIRFWCTYKGADKLVLALSKVDMLAFDKAGIRRCIALIERILKGYHITGIPIVPISIKLSGSFGSYTREAHNVLAISKEFSWYTKVALLPAIQRIQGPSYPPPGILCASIHRRFGDSILRVKILAGEITKDSYVKIGPLKSKDREDKALYFMAGYVKSLKGEDARVMSQSLCTGEIGGVKLSHLKPLSREGAPQGVKKQELSDYKILSTTILFSGDCVFGNAVTLSISDSEVSDDVLGAFGEILPKEPLQFYWNGKTIHADVIEFYKKDNIWYLTLYPLSNEYRSKKGGFAVPAGQRHSCPVVIRSAKEFELTTQRSVTRVSTYVNFILSSLRDITPDKLYIVRAAFSDIEYGYLTEDFAEIHQIAKKDVVFNDLTYEMDIRNVSAKDLGRVLRALRDFINDYMIMDYSLYLRED